MANSPNATVKTVLNFKYMENVFLTSLTIPEVRELFRQELECFFLKNPIFMSHEIEYDNQIQFTISELAAYLKCTKATIQSYKKRGIFPYYQTGRTVYFKKLEIDAALAVTKNKKNRYYAGKLNE